MRRINVLPKCTTVAACCRRPVIDCSSRCVHERLFSQAEISPLRRANLPWGRHSSFATLSISMPKNVRHVVGPSHLSTASGTPSLLMENSFVELALSCPGSANGYVVIKVVPQM